MPGETYNAYPNSDDVLTLMSGAGIDVPANMDVDSFINETIDEWEADTEYRPFWVDPGTSPSDYPFNPPGYNKNGHLIGGGRKLLLDRGFISVASVTVRVTPDSVGTALVENSDYWLLPYNYAADGVPITSIEFACQQWGEHRSLIVHGVAGYGIVLTSDVWNAIRKKAAARVLRAMREALNATGVVAEKSGDDEIEYGKLLTQGNTWNDEADAVKVRKTLIR